MPWVDVIRLLRSLRSYNDVKNYDTYYDMEVMNGKKETGVTGRERVKDFKWSTWGIESALEYDQQIVPTLGNGAWAAMMQKPGMAAHTRRGGRYKTNPSLKHLLTGG